MYSASAVHYADESIGPSLRSGWQKRNLTTSSPADEIPAFDGREHIKISNREHK